MSIHYPALSNFNITKYQLQKFYWKTYRYNWGRHVPLLSPTPLPPLPEETAIINLVFIIPMYTFVLYFHSIFVFP